MNSRRKFLTYCGTIAGAAGLAYKRLGSTIISDANKPKQFKGMMTLRFKPYELQMKHVFTIAESSRSTTPVMLTEIAFGNTTGTGKPPCLLTLVRHTQQHPLFCQK